ncbi:MAG: tetratricopeptide repeat protein [Chloroflexi bacterium]|nr:tetratricopeptide repeat protein [Chloroflexota bacterium]MCI0576884.1 tetratricopeptide repeat protein [Chloroflexota bacterium]MCI0646462.1 tetratricopeptide repeat protein [Chloroflexota bacterium]MCI0729917.1 tetratricopeptide repeat protein [Chloroflexota bacterium]
MTGLIFSLLGQLQIEHRRLGAITLANRKAIGLLAYLLIESDHAHSREFLLGLLWPNLPTAAAQNNLRVTWSHLQKALGTSDSDEQPHLIGNRLTLHFNPLSDHELDVARFHTLIEACRLHPHPDQNDCLECAARLTEALDLVRGEFLDEFSLPNCLQFDEWLLMQRQRFQVQVTAALEQLAAFHERAGRLAEAERATRRLLEYDPLSESAYRQLMRVLARADQRSAALDAYETCRRVLATELGLAPAVETVTLAEQIRAVAPFEAHATRAALPPVLTRFLGRQQESARLVDLLSRRTVRLVTLTGPGGVGKTRLALEVANRMAGVFAHDICLVELAGVADGSAVDDAVAAALRLPTNTGRSSTAAIVDYLRDKTMLLALDNCEHLVKACARLVQTLGREAAGLTVLATSRVPLHLAEEHVVRLEPFATPAINDAERLTVAESLNFDSVQLFTNRAAQSLLHFRLTDANVLAVARICQQLDGIPLAIEIAAAQVRTLPIEAIAERLGQRFTWLNRRAGETMPRQRTLHTLIDWSYGLLSHQERPVLRRLAVFAGGWTLEAAEAVSTPGEPCAEVLAELVDHSLVVFGADAERRRYSMHETIRQFAQEQLRGSDQEADALERHARYYAQLVSRAAENRAGRTLPERLRTVQDDHDNLRRAFEWLLAHDREQALAMVAQLGTELKFWELGGFFQEGRRWLQRALEGTQGSVSIQRAQALLAAADLSSAISDFDYGLQCARQAQQLFQQLGDGRQEIDARLMYCDLARYAGELAHLKTQIEEALQMAEHMSYTAGIAKGKQLLAINIVYTTGGEFEAAIQYEIQSVALWRELDSPFELATALNLLGADLLELHEYAAARQAFLECRDLYRSLGYQRGVALAMHNLGETAHGMGEYASARELLCESLRMRRHLRLPRGYPYSFELLAQVNESEGRYEQAVQLLAAAETLRIRIGAPLEQVAQKHVTAVLARARARLGDIAFELAWSKGATMTTEQAIALALS